MNSIHRMQAGFLRTPGTDTYECYTCCAREDGLRIGEEEEKMKKIREKKTEKKESKSGRGRERRSGYKFANVENLVWKDEDG